MLLDTYQFSYLIYTLLLLLIWSVLFISNKSYRKESLAVGLLFGIAGIIVAGIYVVDWWNPITVFGKSTGIEDFIFSFSIGGIGSIIYSVIFNKKIIKKDKRFDLYKNKKFILTAIVLAFVFFVSFYLLSIDSFLSSLLGFTVVISYMLYRRKDLTKNALISGVLLSLVTIIPYIVIEFITPGWVENTWYFNFTYLPRISIFHDPIEDIIWFMFAGAFTSTWYKYWREVYFV